MLDNLKEYHIILASNSPRRRELLAGLGLDFEVRTLPGIDESYPDSLEGSHIPLYIARKKAEAYRTYLHKDELMENWRRIEKGEDLKNIEPLD